MFNRHSTTDNTFANNFRSQFGYCGPDKLGKRGDWKQKMNGFFAGRKAANIEEDEQSFIISLYAAGLQKDGFKVSVTDDVLTIAYSAKAEADSSKYVYREYTPVSFERSFQLNGRALAEQINATYNDGVLKVMLPKNPETNKPAQEIFVA